MSTELGQVLGLNGKQLLVTRFGARGGKLAVQLTIMHGDFVQLDAGGVAALVKLFIEGGLYTERLRDGLGEALRIQDPRDFREAVRKIIRETP